MFFLAIWIVVLLLILVITFDLSSFVGQEMSRNFKRNVNLAKLVFNFAKLWRDQRFVLEADPRHLDINKKSLTELKMKEVDRERNYFANNSTDVPLLVCVTRLNGIIEYDQWSKCVTTLTR